MKAKSIFLQNRIFSLIFSILSIEILFCYLYESFTLPMFLVRALFITLFFQVFNTIRLNKSNRIMKYSITFIGVFLIFILSIKIISPDGGGISRIIFSGDILSEDFKFSLSIIGCFILSIIFYVISVMFLRVEIIFIVFTLLTTIYFKKDIVSSIFIYFYIISFFTIFIINKDTLAINKLGLFLVVAMAIISLIIPIPRSLPNIEEFNFIKSSIKPKKVKFNIEDNDNVTDIYLSREKDKNEVLYTFTGDNPKYFISRSYERLLNNQWTQVSDNLTNGYIDLDDEYKYLYDETEIIKGLIDICNTSNKDINNIKDAPEKKQNIKKVKIIPKYDSKIYIHPSYSINYDFFDSYNSHVMNGLNMVYTNDLNVYENNDTRYVITYADEYPEEGSKNSLLMKNLSNSFYNEIVSDILDEILNDKEYINKLRTKEGIKEFFKSEYPNEKVDFYIPNMIVDYDDYVIAINMLDYEGEYFESLYKDKLNEYLEKKHNVYKNMSEDEFYKRVYNNIIYKRYDSSYGINIKFYNQVMQHYYNSKDIYIETTYEYYNDGSDFKQLDGITSRMRELAEELTDDKKSVYSNAKAIENYFKSGEYKYSFNVPKSSEKNPMDYFIFKGKRGYCIQYATAMVQLCRAAGIPARYVEGYYVTEEDKVGDVYEIKDSNAHAFVQVYIKNYGWKIFDPTPGFYVDEDKNMVTSENGKVSYFDILIYVIFMFIIIALIIFIYIKLTYRKRRIKNILKKSNEEALEEIILYSIELLKKCNISYEEGETEMKFANKVDKILNITFQYCMSKYYESKYALKKVNSDDVSFALTVNNEIYNYLKKQKKKRGDKGEK